MEVSAQVTFVTWLLECFANLCIIVVWMFVYNATSAGTTTLGMLFYYLILPYTYLMNSSHNRNLVVGNGWRNTFRNAVGISNKDNKGDIARVTKTNDNKVDRSDIFMTSKSRHIIQQSQDLHIHQMPNVPSENQPSTSKMVSDVTQVTEGYNTSQSSASESAPKFCRQETI